MRFKQQTTWVKHFIADSREADFSSTLGRKHLSPYVPPDAIRVIFSSIYCLFSPDDMPLDLPRHVDRKSGFAHGRGVSRDSQVRGRSFDRYDVTAILLGAFFFGGSISIQYPEAVSVGYCNILKHPNQSCIYSGVQCYRGHSCGHQFLWSLLCFWGESARARVLVIPISSIEKNNDAKRVLKSSDKEM